MTNPSAHSDRYEAQLTPRQAHALRTALLSRKRRVEDIRKIAPPWNTGPRTGQRPSTGVLSRLRECFIQRQAVAENEAANGIVFAVLPDTLPGTTHDQFDTVGHKCLTSLAVSQRDSQSFLRLSTARNRVEHERQRLAQRETALNLAEQKFRWDSCERFLKWYEDRRVQEVAEGDGDNSAKIEALGRLMFGETWDPVPKIPETTDPEIQGSNGGETTDFTDRTDSEPANHTNERENKEP